MSTENTNILTSPVGQIIFMAAETPVTDKKTGRVTYSVKLAIDPKDDKEGWLSTVSDINSAKVVTAQTYRGKSEELKAVFATGKVCVESKSNFKPEVYDKAGNIMTDNPFFFTGSTGTAQMYVEPYHGEKGGTINLVGIKIHSLDSHEGATSGVERETRLAQLRALAAQE